MTPEEITALLPEHPGLRLVILHGSRARGDGAPDADWDFGVLTDGRTDLAALTVALTGLLAPTTSTSSTWNGRVPCSGSGPRATASRCWNTRRESSWSSAWRPSGTGATPAR